VPNGTAQDPSAWQALEPLLAPSRTGRCWPGSGPATTGGASAFEKPLLRSGLGAPGLQSHQITLGLGSTGTVAARLERWASSWASPPLRIRIKLKLGSPDVQAMTGPWCAQLPGPGGAMAGRARPSSSGCQWRLGPGHRPAADSWLPSRGVVLVGAARSRPADPDA